MPCTDGGVPFPPSREEVLNDKVPVPMLCALLSLIEEEGTLEGRLADVDWKEAGITKAEFREWWETHKRRDAERRQRELSRTLPLAPYVVREEVTHDNRHWFVTKVVVERGETTVHMVTADDAYPIRKESFKVRKA